MSLNKLIEKMDGLEAGFDRIAERSLLSASRTSLSRRHSIEADERAYQDIVSQLRVVQEAKSRQDSSFQEERASMQKQIHEAKTLFQDAISSVDDERDRANHLERELRQVRGQLESELSARRIVEQRNADLQKDIELQRSELNKTLVNAADQSRIIDNLRQELSQVQKDFDDVKALESRNADKINSLVEEQAVNLRNLETARARGEDLEAQIEAVRRESTEVSMALKEASTEKDRLLRAQASEHDRIIRDHLAEADGDRAVLERQFFELKAVQEHTNRQMKDLRAEVEITNADANGLRHELQRVELELREAQHVERLLRDDLKAGQTSRSDFEQQLEDARRLSAQLLDVSINFRDSHEKALALVQMITAHPSASKQPGNSMVDSIFTTGFRHSSVGQPDEPSPIDPSDPTAALDILRTFDHDHFLEAITKTGAVIRKWQKQCKEYRDRAKSKISFRNFAKGDLALFLPTRNSVSKPWAAFNVSFPHYFLQANDHLAEQLKSREWIVARITSIVERVVDHQDPNSNPYGLGEGVKYYMLEVEDWTQPASSKKRSTFRKISNEKQARDSSFSGTSPTLPPGPPEAEVEESFRVTHPPTSALFPVRSRSNSSPGARPSSLSKLLAQAAPDGSSEQNPKLSSDIMLLPKVSQPLPAPLAVQQVPSLPQSNPVIPPTPLRPGSRASRISTTSRFSGGLLSGLVNPAAVSPATKAAPTTGLTEQPLLISSPSGVVNPFNLRNTPPGDGLISDSIMNAQSGRRRTASHNIPATSPLAAGSSTQMNGRETARVAPTMTTATRTLASLASSWGVPFGRRRPPTLVESNRHISSAEGASSDINLEVAPDDHIGELSTK